MCEIGLDIDEEDDWIKKIEEEDNHEGASYCKEECRARREEDQNARHEQHLHRGE